MIISKSRTEPQQIEGMISASRERVWLIGIAVAVLLLAFVNLTGAPRTWFDEGSHMMVPKTIVQDGVYADKSADGYRYHGPTIGIGPTIMLPIALVYKIFGIGLLQARVVIVGYLLCALVAFYYLARRLHAPLIALVALGVLLASRTLSYEGMIDYGRQVLGEVPGLAFMFAGLLAWVCAIRHPDRTWRYSILAGLGFGMTVVTKNQFTLILMPSLALIALLDWQYYKAGTWVVRIVPAGIAALCFAAWTFTQFAFIGPGTFMENFQQTRQAASGAIFVFSLQSTLRAGYYLLRPDLYGGLLIPALLYGLWRARHRNAQGLTEGFVALLVAVWLTWYVCVSLGWPRYAFPAVALGAILVARLVIDLIGWLRATQRRTLAIAFGVYVVLAGLLSISVVVRGLLQPDYSALQMASYLRANVPRDALVATWEPEMGALGDHRWDYPPQKMLDSAVRYQWLGGQPVQYDGLAAKAPYVVVGRFGNLTGIYDGAILQRDYIAVQEIGSYILFKRK
jgi:4-amino-4-deoxy-L-arabinose transferase-like glycosyltransferase